MSRASRRERGRQIEAGRLTAPDQSTADSTRQIGALRFNLNETSLGIDSSKLEAPERGYDADVAWIDYRTGKLSLYFAKLNRIDPSMLQSCLEIRYPPEDFVNTFWRISAGFLEKLKTYVDSWPHEAMDLVVPPTKATTERFYSEWVSFTYMSHSGTEAALDFYHLSPAAIARYAQRKTVEGMRLRAVVRVQMTVFELFALMNRATPIVEDIMKILPSSHRQILEQEKDRGLPE